MARKKIRLSPVERALILLARYLERCPYNIYKVEQEVLEELGYERKKSGDK